nr:PREDICTED: uncharacterized protein LOC105663220 [Megachile rotundata]
MFTPFIENPTSFEVIVELGSGACEYSRQKDKSTDQGGPEPNVKSGLSSADFTYLYSTPLCLPKHHISARTCVKEKPVVVCVCAEPWTAVPSCSSTHQVLGCCIVLYKMEQGNHWSYGKDSMRIHSLLQICNVSYKIFPFRFIAAASYQRAVKNVDSFLSVPTQRRVENRAEQYCQLL